MTHLIINHYGTTLLNAHFIKLDTKELKDIIGDKDISSLRAKDKSSDYYNYDNTWIILILSEKPIKKYLNRRILKTCLTNGNIYTSNSKSYFSVRNNVTLYTLNFAKTYMFSHLML